jgi:two-component system chemotaxis response regulator CheB
MAKIKVFIVEDSILMQKIIVDILSGDPDIAIVGTAKFGKDALENIPKLKPDIVTLDLNLPDIDGLQVLRKLMVVFPVRVIMFSAYTQKGAEITMKALELGALDFIPKPSGETSLNLYNFKDEIISKIKMAATIDLSKRVFPKETLLSSKETAIKNIIIIGASTGGPKAIIDLMTGMPKDINGAILIVQHMPSGFTRSFAERISWHAGIKTKEAEDGDQLINGAAYIAPSGYHMVLEKSAHVKKGYLLRLDETPLVNYVRPAVDVTLFSAAETFEGGVMLGVILTGMGKDGLEGVKKIKDKGGKVIAQDEASCIVYGMPRAIVSEGLADDVLPLNKIAKKIVEYINYG